MRLIGMLGGMSWESTRTYYEFLNRVARDRLGGLHSAEVVLWSFDFADIERLQADGDWSAAARVLAHTGRRLEQSGAACLIMCTNTMHCVADEVAAAISIPLIHIADATADAIRAAKVRRPLLLATRYTMEQAFYRDRLKLAGVDAVVPEPDERADVHRIIYAELCRGRILPESRARFDAIIARAAEDGADGVILGCTEIGLLIPADETPVPAFDSTRLHAEAAMAFALAEPLAKEVA